MPGVWLIVLVSLAMAAVAAPLLRINPADWGAAKEAVQASLARRGVGLERAMDLAQEAVERSLPGGYEPWDGTLELIVHVGKVAERLRSKYAKRAEARPAANVDCEDFAAPLLDPERAAHLSDVLRRVGEAVRKEITGAIELRVAEMLLVGNFSLEQQMAETGFTRSQVEDARARVSAFLRKWLAREAKAAGTTPAKALS